MFSEMPRWFFVVVLLACVVGMLVWARGNEHHHGQYVGSLGAVHSTSLTARA
jgi:hypothetical protein